MCAWWGGQPIYGSNPTSKYVRENFAYLKALTDLLENSNVSLADLTKLHAVLASAAQIDRNVSLPSIGSLGNDLDTAGAHNYVLTYEPSVVLFLGSVQGGLGGTYGTQSIGFDDGASHVCIYQSDNAFHETITNFTASNSIYLTAAGGTQISRASITAKNVTGFTITVVRTGPLTGFFGFYLAFP